MQLDFRGGSEDDRRTALAVGAGRFRWEESGRLIYSKEGRDRRELADWSTGEKKIIINKRYCRRFDVGKLWRPGN